VPRLMYFNPHLGVFFGRNQVGAVTGLGTAGSVSLISIVWKQCGSPISRRK
jgi:hypothetical protein